MTVCANILVDVGNFLIEPYFQAFQNFKTAWNGRRVDHSSVSSIIQDLLTRILHAVAGVFLMIPFLNLYCLEFLRLTPNSSFIFPKGNLLNSCNIGSVQNDLEILLDERANGETVVYDGFVLPHEPRVTSEEYARRKRNCIERVSHGPYQEYERAMNDYRVQLRDYNRLEGFADAPLPTLPIAPLVPLKCVDEILEFDLDLILATYRDDYPPINLEEFFDFAEVESANRTIIIGDLMSYHLHTSSQRSTAKKLLSNLYHFLKIKKDLFEGTERENAFKAMIRDLFDRIYLAHRNCVDQVNSQLESIIIDVIANFETANESTRTLKNYLVHRASFEVFKYRANLIKEICLMEYPNEIHMADFERAVKQQLADRIGLRGEIFQTGAILGFRDLEQKTEHIVNIFRNGVAGNHSSIPDPVAFLQNPNRYLHLLNKRRSSSQYRPENYLLENLKTYHGAMRNLRNNFMIWIRQYFSLDEENELTEQFIEAISANRDFRIDEGGDFKDSAILYLLEQVGFLRLRRQ